jgi:hypothetical protein
VLDSEPDGPTKETTDGDDDDTFRSYTMALAGRQYYSLYVTADAPYSENNSAPVVSTASLALGCFLPDIFSVGSGSKSSVQAHRQADLLVIGSRFGLFVECQGRRRGYSELVGPTLGRQYGLERFELSPNVCGTTSD